MRLHRSKGLLLLLVLMRLPWNSAFCHVVLGGALVIGRLMVGAVERLMMHLTTCVP